MGFIKRFLKIKPRAKRKGLEQAKEMQLITEDEFLRLKIERAEEKYAEFVNKNKIETKVKRRRK